MNNNGRPTLNDSAHNVMPFLISFQKEEWLPLHYLARSKVPFRTHFLTILLISGGGNGKMSHMTKYITGITYNECLNSLVHTPVVCVFAARQATCQARWTITCQTSSKIFLTSLPSISPFMAASRSGSLSTGLSKYPRSMCVKTHLFGHPCGYMHLLSLHNCTKANK